MATKSRNSKNSDNTSKMTSDHDEIQRWVEARGGKPATIKGTEKKGEDAGMLRIDLPGGASNPPLEPISWKAFFEKFDQEELALIYQETGADGKESYFCKLVRRGERG